MLLAVALAMLQAAPAFAAIQGSDYVGSTSVTDRGLTITEAPTVECECGILCAADGTVLWSRNADSQHAMASVTKIMTAILAIEYGNMEDSYTVSANAASVGESSAGLTAGISVPLYDLLCGLMVHSGNDAAIVIAEGLAGSVDAFVAMMNQKAADLGLTNTHFVTPHGLDAGTDDHYSSAADLCVLARYAMTNETFREVVSMREVTLDYGNGPQTFHSTNSLLNTWDECEGIKTGYTDKAGYCLASAAQRDGVELFAIVLGCSDESERFTDSYKLLDWGFSHYRTQELALAGETLVDVPLSGYTNSTVRGGVAEDVYGMILDYDGDVSIDVSVMDCSSTVHRGDRLGTITWRQGEHVIASAPLVALEHAFKPLAIISIWTAMCRVVGFFTDDDMIADGKLYLQVIEVTRVDDLSGEEIDDELEASIVEDARSNI